jgi:hypothetical protein
VSRASRHAEGRKPGKRRLESLALRGEQRLFGIVGGGEVRVDRVDAQVGARGHVRDGPIQVVVTKTEPVHPGVDLQMAAECRAVASGSGLERAGRAGGRDRRRQGMLEEAIEVADAERAEHQDRDAHARLPKGDPLFDVRAGEHRGTRGLECHPCLTRAVAVGVRLHDGDHARAATEEPCNGAQVAPERREVHAGGGWADHDWNCGPA